LAYRDGHLFASIQVTNTSSGNLVVPSIGVWNWSPEGRLFLKPGPYLGKGTQVVAPGCGVVFSFSIRTASKPVKLEIHAVLGRDYYQFYIGGVSRELGERLPYETWEEVPSSAIYSVVAPILVN